MYRISQGKSRQNQVLFPLIIIFERRGGRIISFWEFNDNSLTYIFLTKVVFVHFLALSSLAHCVGSYRRLLWPRHVVLSTRHCCVFSRNSRHSISNA